MIGLWNYLEDEAKAAQEISRGEEDHLSITLEQAIAQVRSYAKRVRGTQEQSGGLSSVSQNQSAEAFTFAAKATETI